MEYQEACLLWKPDAQCINRLEMERMANKENHCCICGTTITHRPQKYCSYECKVEAWERRGKPGGSPPEWHLLHNGPRWGEEWVRKLKEAPMSGIPPSPDMLLKTISEIVIENQVLKKEVELLRAQLEYIKGDRTSLRNSKGYQPSDLLTPEEAADYLKIAKGTLNSWRSTGEHQIPFTRAGRSIRYRVADLDAFLYRSERAFASRMRKENLVQ